MPCIRLRISPKSSSVVSFIIVVVIVVVVVVVVYLWGNMTPNSKSEQIGSLEELPRNLFWKW